MTGAVAPLALSSVAARISSSRLSMDSVSASRLCVPVDEEQVAGVQFNAPLDALGEGPGRSAQAPKIGKRRLDRGVVAVLPEQPAQDGHERPIGCPVGDQRKVQRPHSTRDPPSAAASAAPGNSSNCTSSRSTTRLSVPGADSSAIFGSTGFR